MARVILALALVGFVVHVVKAAVVPQVNEAGGVNIRRQMEQMDELPTLERYQSVEEVRQTSAFLAAA